MGSPPAASRHEASFWELSGRSSELQAPKAATASPGMTIDALQQGMNFSQFRVILGQALDHSTRRGGIRRLQAATEAAVPPRLPWIQTRGNGGRVTCCLLQRKPPDR